MSNIAAAAPRVILARYSEQPRGENTIRQEKIWNTPEAILRIIDRHADRGLFSQNKFGNLIPVPLSPNEMLQQSIPQASSPWEHIPTMWSGANPNTTIYIYGLEYVVRRIILELRADP